MAQFGSNYSLEITAARPKSENLKEVKKSVREGLRFAQEAIKSKGYDLIILDEVNIALNKGITKKEEILELIKRKPSQMELILTGRGAPRQILEAADLVTEMVSLKHPYEKGMKARRGIEY
jgi:cob(I)alamin adenosyltransferase